MYHNSKYKRKLVSKDPVQFHHVSILPHHYARGPSLHCITNNMYYLLLFYSFHPSFLCHRLEFGQNQMNAENCLLIKQPLGVSN